MTEQATRSCKIAVLYAILAAALYALNIPLSKLLLGEVSPTVMAGLLYLGAGMGMSVLLLVRRLASKPLDAPRLERADLPFTIAMVVLDIAAPILLMLGVAVTPAANASLLNNFEIVATSLIAFAILREPISKRLWLAIALVVCATVILGFEREGALGFNKGSLLVLGACVCWGMENNCTRSISHKSAEQIVLIKGIFSGLGGIAVAHLAGERLPALLPLLCVLLLGFVAYGLSIRFYIGAQKTLGAAKTGAFYAVAPFLGVVFSFLFLGELPTLQFYIGLAVMALATVLTVRDTLA